MDNNFEFGKPATEKQIDFIEYMYINYNIKSDLVNNLDDIYNLTLEEAQNFIKSNLSTLKKKQQKRRLKRRTNQRKRYYLSDNSYSGPYGTDIVDCYDYGIYPWGNS